MICKKTRIMAVAVVMLMMVSSLMMLIPAEQVDATPAAGSPSNYQDAKLWVLGNADGDEDIDASDVTVINNAVTAGATVSDAPMCDADHSGTIDATDATFVQSLIDGTATFCYYYNVDGAICKFTFHDKINAIALHRCVVRSATVLDNFDDNVKIVGMDSAPFGEAEFNVSQNYPGTVSVGILGDISYENCASFVTSYQSDDPDIGLVIMVGTIDYYLTSLETWADDLGFQVVRIPTWEHHPTEGLITTAYLFSGLGENTDRNDTNCWHHALKYADWAFGYLDMIESKSALIPAEEKLKVLGVYTTTVNYEHANHTRGPGSGDYENYAAAGGDNIATRFGPGSKQSWTMESLAAQCSDLDVLILMSANCFDNKEFNVTDDMKELTEKVTDYVKAGCKVYAISWALNGAPFVVQMVYYAKIFMPGDSELAALSMDDAWSGYLDMIGWSDRTDISLDLVKVCSDVNNPGVAGVSGSSGSLDWTLVGGVAGVAIVVIAILAFALLRRK